MTAPYINPLLLAAAAQASAQDHRKPPPKTAAASKEEYQQEVIFDHMHMTCGCHASLMERFRHDVEEYEADKLNTNEALKRGYHPKLVRHAVNLARCSARMSDVATLLMSIHNERPFVKAVS